MDFKDLVRLFGRRFKTIAAIFAIAVIAAAGFSYAQKPVYHSSAQIFISTNDSNSANAFYSSFLGIQRVQSYADLATSSTVMRDVINKLDLNLTPAELGSKVTSSVSANTVLITLEVRDSSARTAQVITSALASELAQYITQVETPKGSTAALVKATVTKDASFDGTAISPRTGLNIAIGCLLGLLIGAATALIRDLLDTTIKSPADVEAAAKAPVMTHVVHDPAISKAPLISDAGTNLARTEAFRVLRTNLQFLDLDNPPRSLVITSATPNEGKTTTATNLAIALAQAGRRVLLIDGDLRRPNVARLLNLEPAVGLTTVLVGRTELADSIQLHQPSGVQVLSSGPMPPNPTEILQSQAMRDLLTRLRSAYEYVIIDAPPLLPVADAAIMSTDADGTVLVVRHGKTTKDQLNQAARRVGQVGGRIFGVVVNMSPRRERSTYYSYGYAYDYEPEKPKKLRKV